MPVKDRGTSSCRPSPGLGQFSSSWRRWLKSAIGRNLASYFGKNRKREGDHTASVFLPTAEAAARTLPVACWDDCSQRGTQFAGVRRSTEYAAGDTYPLVCLQISTEASRYSSA